YFFFQAEDGIRDKLVTGVQTCALPISSRRVHPLRASGHLLQLLPQSPLPQVSDLSTRTLDRRASIGAPRRDPVAPTPCVWKKTRSEERRVGKEWRCGKRRHHEKKRIEG